MVIVFVMILPSLILISEKSNFVFPARMSDDAELKTKVASGPMQYEGKTADTPGAIKMSYEVISRTGTFSNIWDFVQSIEPGGNEYIVRGEGYAWGNPS